MNRITPIITVLSFLIFTGCGNTEFKESEVKEMFFKNDDGIIAGYTIGDDWNEIKKNKHAGWEIIEEVDKDLNASFYQLRKDMGDGYNMMFLNFQLDDNKKVERIEFHLSATEENEATRIKVKNTFIKRFNELTVSNSTESWTYHTKEGEKINIELSEFSTGDKSTLSITAY